MKIHHNLITCLFGLILPLSYAQAIIIFNHDFNGTTDNLDGLAPDTDTVGVEWVATTMFDRNGDVNISDAGSGSATLAFTPTDGFILLLTVLFPFQVEFREIGSVLVLPMDNRMPMAPGTDL